MSALQLLQYIFYGFEDDFGLDSHLMMGGSVLMYLSCAVLAEIDELGLTHSVRWILLDAFTSIVAFERQRDFHWAAMRLASAGGWLPF